MTTITIPLDSELNGFINEQVKLGRVSSKADLVRQAIIRFKEEKFIEEILLAKREAKEGKIFKGDLDKLAEGF